MGQAEGGVYMGQVEGYAWIRVEEGVYMGQVEGYAWVRLRGIA